MSDTEPWRVAAEHPYSENDQMDRVLGELRTTVAYLSEAFPRIIAAAAISLAMRKKLDTLDRNLHINGKSHPSLLADIQEAAEQLAAACQRVRLLHEAENSVVAPEPVFDDLLAGLDSMIRPDTLRHPSDHGPV